MHFRFGSLGSTLTFRPRGEHRANYLIGDSVKKNRLVCKGVGMEWAGNSPPVLCREVFSVEPRRADRKNNRPLMKD